MVRKEPIGKFCERKISTISTNHHGEIEYIDISSIDNDKKIIVSTKIFNIIDAPTRAKQIVVQGDILISTVRPNLNAIAIINDEFIKNPIASTGFCVLRCKEEMFNRYLYHFCQSQYFINELTRQATGANYPAVTDGVIKGCLVPVYTKDEQYNISSIFDKINDLILLRKKQLAKLDELVKSRFVEMFGDSQYPKMYFGDVCIFLRNGASIKQTPGAGGYPITRIETISNDTFNTDRFGYADIHDISIYQKYLLEKGDILISHINSIAYLGRAIQYHGQVNSPIIHGMNLLCARIKPEYNPTYIEFFLKSSQAKNYISSITKKSVNQASITVTDLKKMEIPSYPTEMQNQFAAFVEQTEKTKAAIKQSLERLETLKKSLMQEFFG